MNQQEVYLFHQTPRKLANDLISHVPLEDGDIVLEPFKGEGAFYDSFPNNVTKEWCEIEQGRDWLSHTDPVDWVVSNPPFRLDNGDKRENAFFKILSHYSKKVRKGIAFLGNDYCLSTLTPRRLDQLKADGLYIHKIVVCGVKKWRGRYFFIVFRKEPSTFYQCLTENYV